MKFSQILKSSAEFLKKSGVPDAAVDSEILILHAVGTDRLTAYRDNPGISEAQRNKIQELLERRAEGEPVQYIAGHVDFLSLRINVGKGVLIPRPETELLAQEAIETLNSQKKPLSRHFSFETENTLSLRGGGKGWGDDSEDSSLHILDLCTGSGCLALAIAREFPDAIVFGADISEASVRYAMQNAKLNGIKNAFFLCGSLFDPINESLKFDMIVSNPPYIRTSDIPGLQKEIKDWEPAEALNGGRDGLDFYRKIFSEAGRFLKKHGKILLEIGFGQAEAIHQTAEENGFSDIVIKKDFSGIERILKAGK